ncbi:group II truncated hemoglobin [Pseudoalteromonas xiamenensis]|uniref:Group II truncated hemoglobin n=1 Tax=Pseudoalteromonas xiamenensis TaxID=882626 RepID=A0A975DKP1_9GAMM|nr:group II truncated hemoglobin [Pseudoalteromonas xiamenensis]QTH72890.1 group II truncated hemoglobin [Pseudoalteromonas xiamenensis]
MKQLIKRIFQKDASDKNSNTASTPDTPAPDKTPYEIMGGELAVRALANRFYDLMETEPFAKPLYDMHPLPLDRIRQVFFEFLSGWLGGPDLFAEQYGHPRLRMRHMPFPIDKALRDQWMHCMNKALDIEIDNPLLREGLRNSLSQLATHMINQE